MQNELKSAIRFNDFVAYFGARGVVALAWWMGAAHADRIRQDQNSYPFLQINGAAGSGKSLLLEYLQKLNGLTPRAHSLARATKVGRTRIYASVERPIVICESDGETDQAFDWDELKPFFSSGGLIPLPGKNHSEEMTFRGAVLIAANQPLECSDAVRSRMVVIDLSAADAHTPRIRPEAIGDLNADEASAFGIKVAQAEDWISSTIKVFLPGYQGQLMHKYGPRLNARTALNCAQMLALLDLLCSLLAIPQDVQLEARKVVHDIAFLDTIPY